MNRFDAGRHVTPLLLTSNEESNLSRTLAALRWAPRVVILDSLSTDRTAAIAAGFPNVSLRRRNFDTHGGQWESAIRESRIDTPFVLALDADMILPPSFVTELEESFLPGGFDAGPHGRLFRPEKVRVGQRGHTQVFESDGPCYAFRTHVLHDDRKPLARWAQSQLRYADLEAARILSGSPSGWKDRLRLLGLMPLIAGSAAYLLAGGPFAGRAALRYALERAAFESLLAVRLIEAGRTKEPD